MGGKKTNDLELVTKSKLKQIKFDTSKVQQEEYVGTTRCILLIPFERGHEEHFVVTNRPTMQRTRRSPFGGNNYNDIHHMGIEQWDDLYVEFRNSEVDSKAIEWIHSINTTPTGRSGPVSSYKKNMTLEMIDPTGVVLERWHLVGCFPTEMMFHQQDTRYDNPTVGVNFSIDRATLILNT